MSESIGSIRAQAATGTVLTPDKIAELTADDLARVERSRNVTERRLHCLSEGSGGSPAPGRARDHEQSPVAELPETDADLDPWTHVCEALRDEARGDRRAARKR